MISANSGNIFKQSCWEGNQLIWFAQDIPVLGVAIHCVGSRTHREITIWVRLPAKAADGQTHHIHVLLVCFFLSLV